MAGMAVGGLKAQILSRASNATDGQGEQVKIPYYRSKEGPLWLGARQRTYQCLVLIM